jgi:hypothetical protein
LILDVLTVAVLVFVGSRLVTAAHLATRGRGRHTARAVWRGLRPWHVVTAIPVLVVVATVASVLVAVPGLDWGWWTAIGGEGNPVLGGTERTAGGMAEWLVPLAFVLVLTPALPLLVENEERIFRAGSEHRTTAERVRAAVVFGAVHALIGIPLGVALALSVGGAWFTWVYLRGWRRAGAAEALLESSRAHLAYNGVIVALVLLSLGFGWY